MNLKRIYIPFGSIFPVLASFLSAREDYLKVHFPRVNPTTLYGKAHKGVSVIDRRISNLHLIMHRIRINSGINLLPNEEHFIDFIYLPIDFDSFIIWLRMIMDQIAFLTPLFYEKQNVIPSNSFNDQLSWFTKKNTSFDTEYSNYLSRNLSWFTDLRDTRDNTLHRYYWSYTEISDKRKVSLKIMRGNTTEKLIESLDKKVGEIYLAFMNFSKYYEKHFIDLLKTRDKNLEDYDPKTQMVEKYYLSIEYFVNKAKS